VTDRQRDRATRSVTVGRIYAAMRPNNSNHDSAYGAVILAQPVQEFI